jgi:hypothetical protein
LQAVIAAGAAALMVAAATPQPKSTPTARIGAAVWPRPRVYTLLDPSLALPPMAILAPDLDLVARELADEPTLTPHTGAAPERPVSWQLGYRHAQLGNMLPSDALRTDPSTGYTRALDTDVLALGMSWQLAGNKVGVGYQLQSARGGIGAGLGRFLPGSEAATHAFTLGLTRPFGAGLPPPAPPPMLVLVDEPSADSTPSPTP